MKDRVRFRPRPRLIAARDQSLETRLRQERIITASHHSIERMRERCPLAKTLSDAEIGLRIVELAGKSQAWGLRSVMERGTVAAYRLAGWGPFRLIFVLVHEQGPRWVVKTVMTESMAQERIKANASAKFPRRSV